MSINNAICLLRGITRCWKNYCSRWRLKRSARQVINQSFPRAKAMCATKRLSTYTEKLYSMNIIIIEHTRTNYCSSVRIAFPSVLEGFRYKSVIMTSPTTLSSCLCNWPLVHNVCTWPNNEYIAALFKMAEIQITCVKMAVIFPELLFIVTLSGFYCLVYTSFFRAA